MTAGVPGNSPRGSWGNLLSLQVGQFLTLASGAAAVAAVSRLLGPERYGAMTLIITVAQYLVTVTVSWTSQAVVRFGREEWIETGAIRRVFWTRLAIVSAPLLLAIIVVAVFREVITAAAAGDARLLLLVAAVALLLALSDHIDGSLQAASRWGRFALLGLAEKGCFLISLLFLVALPDARSPAVAVALLGASIGVRVAWGGWDLFRSGAVGRPVVDGAVARRLFDYSWPHLLTFTVGYFSAFIEPFLIAKYLSRADVGIYNTAFQISLFAVAVLSPFSLLLLPAVTAARLRNDERLAHMLLDRLIPQCVFLVNILIAIAIAGAVVAFPLIFGPPYAAGVTPLLILLATIAFQAITAFYSPFLGAYDLTRHAAVLNTAGGIVFHLVPTFLLIRSAGIAGAATSWLIWYVASASYFIFVVRRRIHVHSWAALSYSWIALTALVIALLAPGSALRTLLMAALLLVAWVSARVQGVFARDDLAVLIELGVPPRVRSLVLRLYARVGIR